MEKFEYENRFIEEGEGVLKKLNEWGDDGWEVVWFNPTKRENPMSNGIVNYIETVYYTECLLKRKKN